MVGTPICLNSFLAFKGLGGGEGGGGGGLRVGGGVGVWGWKVHNKLICFRSFQKHLFSLITSNFCFIIFR